MFKTNKRLFVLNISTWIPWAAGAKNYRRTFKVISPTNMSAPFGNQHSTAVQTTRVSMRTQIELKGKVKSEGVKVKSEKVKSE